MSIYVAILILGATGQASRETTVQVSIERVLFGVIAGGLQDVFSKRNDSRNLGRITPTDLALAIDGTERTGWGWAEAAYRVAGYAISGSRLPRAADAGVGPEKGGNQESSSGVGSVEYTYRVRVRGFDIRRSTRIEDGSVSTVTDIWGRIGPKGELYHVRLLIRATESDFHTRLRGTLTGDSRIGDRCGLVERVARRKISEALAEVLYGIETEGRRLYAGGDIHSLGNALIDRMTR